MAEMTPRERVLAAINHQEPDRVPLEIGVDIINPVQVSASGRHSSAGSQMRR